MPKDPARPDRCVRAPKPRRLSRALGRYLRKHPLNAPLPAVVGGLAGYALAHTTSLLPRTPLFQGVVGAVNASFGYELGLMVADLLPSSTRSQSPGLPAAQKSPGLTSTPKSPGLTPTPKSPGLTPTGTALKVAALGAALVGLPLTAMASQRRTAQFCRVPGPTPRWALESAGYSAAIMAFFGVCWRIGELVIDWLSLNLSNRLGWRLAARVLATLITVAATGVLFDHVVLRGIRFGGRTIADRLDHSTPTGVNQPTRPTRSGSHESLEAWDSLGLQGKRFVSGGPDQARLAEVLGPDRPVQDPVRVYAALDGRDLGGIARAVLDELDRTDAWQRSVITLVTTTGRGNANEWSASALEYLTGGDCATMATQYSGLPSAITLFTSREQPVTATRVLFDAVTKRLDAMPAGSRPKLFLAGESLGAYGSNGIFDDPDELLASIDGALWLGTPNFTPLHRVLTATRDAGSSAIAPAIDGGRHIRFAGDPAQLTIGSGSSDSSGSLIGTGSSADSVGHELDEWQSPRVVYLQNETDPVVWWGTRLLYRRPVWLTERQPANTPMGRMRWVPFSTFWQLCADMPVCRNVPEGFGHKYHAAQITPAWAGVLGMDPRSDYSAIEQALLDDITIPPIKVLGI